MKPLNNLAPDMSDEDLYCGGPLVIEPSGADIAVRNFLDQLEAARQSVVEAMAIPSQLLSAGHRLSDFTFDPPADMMIRFLELCEPIWGEPGPDLMAITRDIARS